MKRLLFLSLLITIIFCLFIACQNNNKNTENDYDGNDTNVNSGVLDVPDEYINSEKLREWTNGYSEGLCFVFCDYKSEDGTINHVMTCIDKKGKTIFNLDGYLYETKFHNGYAFVRKASDTSQYWLCDVKGNLIAAEKFGGESFVLSTITSSAFKDGYILLTKANSNFEGSKTLMAVYDSKFNELVPFSEELYNNYLEVADMNATWYYNGYIAFSNERFLNLRNGQIQTDFSNMQLINKSDLWKGNGNSIDNVGFIYDARFNMPSVNFEKDKFIFDLSKYQDTLEPDINFMNKFALLCFDSDNEYYFTLLDESGNFKFDPKLVLEVPANWQHVSYSSYRSNNIIVFKAKHENSTNIVTFDYLGNKIGSLTLDTSMLSDYYDILVSDDVVSIPNSDESWSFYNEKLTPLF